MPNHFIYVWRCSLRNEMYTLHCSSDTVKPDVLLMGTLQTSVGTLVFWLTVWLEQVATCTTKLLSSFGTWWQELVEISQNISSVNLVFWRQVCSGVLTWMSHCMSNFQDIPASCERIYCLPPLFSNVMAIAIVANLLAVETQRNHKLRRACTVKLYQWKRRDCKCWIYVSVNTRNFKFVYNLRACSGS